MSQPSRADRTDIETGPHNFRPYSWLDKHRKRGRCRHCLLPQHAHPVNWWAPARSIGERRRPWRQTYYGTWTSRR